MPDGAAFYPKDLPHRRELEFASRVLNSIEINSSFYSLQQPTSYRRWYGATPENFLFSVKGARFITHMKKLRKVEFRWPISLLPAFSRSKKNLARFFGNSRQTSVGAWNVFARIFQLLPKSTKEAASLGRRHDSKLKARAWLKTERDRLLR
jgi:uncharacterized protein YecE (DUF72 family)